MNVREATVDDKEKWNEFVRANQGGSFLQSWEWGEFLSQVKDKLWRLIVEDENKIIAVCQIFKQNMRLGQSAFYAPRGPVMADGVEPSSKALKLFFEQIDNFAKGEKALTFELDPIFSGENWQKTLAELGFDKTESDMQPRHTLILDLRVGEEELLAQMNQKTRYNIGLARKKGIEIEVDNGAYKEFYELLKKTMRRQKVTFFTPDYFKKILSVPFVKLYLARLEGKVIAANIMIFWNRAATYLSGASDYEYRQVMAPHLLQWQAIKDAKREGLWFYDFWGAAPPDSKGREQNWAGFTKFKMGFSPEAEITEYIGTYEKVYQPVKLGLYRFLRKIYKAG